MYVCMCYIHIRRCQRYVVWITKSLEIIVSGTERIGLDVFVYVCVHVHMYVCMYVCMRMCNRYVVWTTKAVEQNSFWV